MATAQEILLVRRVMARNPSAPNPATWNGPPSAAGVGNKVFNAVPGHLLWFKDEFANSANFKPSQFSLCWLKQYEGNIDD